MRFLIDNALSPIVVERLREAGHDETYVRDYAMQAAPDEAIFDRARGEPRILISADTDFATLLALRAEIRLSLILIRQVRDRRPDRQTALLLANRLALEEELAGGCGRPGGRSHPRSAASHRSRRQIGSHSGVIRRFGQSVHPRF